MNFKVLALILYTLSFLYSMFLQYVRRRSRDNPIPENVKDLYDAETYSKWQSYCRETGAASLISYLVTFPLYFLLIAFDFFPHIVFSSDPILAALTVIAFTVTLDTLTSAVFEYIFTMKIDEKYGFNRSTLKIFISDQIKKWIIYTVIYCAFVALFIKIHQAAGDWDFTDLFRDNGACGVRDHIFGTVYLDLQQVYAS